MLTLPPNSTAIASGTSIHEAPSTEPAYFFDNSTRVMATSSRAFRVNVRTIDVVPPAIAESGFGML